MIVGKLQGSGLIDLLEVLSSSKPLELEGGPPVFDLRLFYETQPGAQVAVGQLVLRGPDLVTAEWGEHKGADALAALAKQQGGRVRIIRSGPADTTGTPGQTGRSARGATQGAWSISSSRW